MRGTNMLHDNLLQYRKMLRLAMMSVARTCILPLQDVLGLDNSCRVNQPGTVEHNWVWRMQPDALTMQAQQELRQLTVKFGRFNWESTQ
jgi:4-alpha-glucanotransferase